MIGIIEFLVENPILLIPLLLIVAVVLFAVIKKLLKLLAIATIAGVPLRPARRLLGIALKKPNNWTLGPIKR